MLYAMKSVSLDSEKHTCSSWHHYLGCESLHATVSLTIFNSREEKNPAAVGIRAMGENLAKGIDIVLEISK